MQQLKTTITNIILNGDKRTTRSGEVISLFNQNMEFDLSKGFPATTFKRLMFKAVVGELLMFLSGWDTIPMLQHFSDKSSEDWTIWTDDAARWAKQKDQDMCWSLGKLYGHQWRNYGGEIDQITQLIDSLKNDPLSRYHVVTAWNPLDRAENAMALPACHRDFQCHVTNSGELNLHFCMRSNDMYLGAPFNIASYALLNHILCRLTGLTPGKLSCNLVDAHVYTDHFGVIDRVLSNPIETPPTLVLPEFQSLDELLGLTAKDFNLVNYKCFTGDASAKLSVG